MGNAGRFAVFFGLIMMVSAAVASSSTDPGATPPSARPLFALQASAANLREQAHQKLLENRKMRVDPDIPVSAQMYVAMTLEAEQVFAEDAQVQAELGVAYHWADNPSEAVLRFRRAHDLAPTWAAPMLGLGRTFLNLNRPEDGLDWCTRALDGQATLVAGDSGVLLLDARDFGMRFETVVQPAQRQELEVKSCVHWAERASAALTDEFTYGEQLIALLINREQTRAPDIRTKGAQKLLPVRLLYEVDEADAEVHRLQLNEIGVALNREQVRFESVRVIGHASTDGSEEHNMKLSESRARNIADYMIEEWNVDPDRLDVCWAGEHDPVVRAPDPLQASRRVEFTYVHYDETKGVSTKGIRRYVPPEDDQLHCWSGGSQ